MSLFAAFVPIYSGHLFVPNPYSTASYTLQQGIVRLLVRPSQGWQKDLSRSLPHAKLLFPNRNRESTYNIHYLESM